VCAQRLYTLLRILLLEVFEKIGGEIMFKRHSENYLSWDEYRERVAVRDKFLFMQETVMKSVKNHFEKIQMGVMCNG